MYTESYVRIAHIVLNAVSRKRLRAYGDAQNSCQMTSPSLSESPGMCT